jgi:hypothetical protein
MFAPAHGIGPIQRRRRAGEQTALLALACESLCSRVQVDRRTEQ